MRAITLAEIDKYISEHNEDESAYVKSSDLYLEEVLDEFFNPSISKGLKLPWAKFDGKFELRKGEVTMWMGINGHGKSLVLGQVMNHLMLQNQKIGIASFEMSPRKTIKRMIKQSAVKDVPTEEYIRSWHKWSAEKLWFYDQHGTVPPHRVLNLCKFFVSLGINHVAIDSLMKVIPNEDDYNGQKKFVDSLCVLARDTGLHIHLVHHSRKGDDESKEPGKMDAKGSGAITDLCDNCVSVWRNKGQKDKPDCVIKVDKQRHFDFEGRFGLFFDTLTQTYRNDEHGKAPMIDIRGGSVCPI